MFLGDIATDHANLSEWAPREQVIGPARLSHC